MRTPIRVRAAGRRFHVEKDAATEAGPPRTADSKSAALVQALFLLDVPVRFAWVFGGRGDLTRRDSVEVTYLLLVIGSLLQAPTARERICRVSHCQSAAHT